MMALGRGLLGMAVIVGIAWLCSADRKRIDWKLAAGGIFLQIALALSILYVPWVSTGFEWAGKVFVRLVGFTQAGVSFLLGPYAAQNHGVVFLIHSLPALIFFSALVSLCYHWGVIQQIVGLCSWLLRRVFRSLSGPEALVVAGNVFLGMCEAPVLAKNYLPKMNRSALFLVMVSGMGTIAGTVMGAYIGILGGADPEAQLFFAKHLLSASVMAAPGSIVLARMIYPQTAEPASEAPAAIPAETREHRGAVEALAAGTSTGIKLMVNVAAMLLVFIALVAMVNYVFEGVVGRYTGVNAWIASFTGGRAEGLTVQFVLGLVLAPFVWLTGVPAEDMMAVGSLLGQKIALNEFVAYIQMQEWHSAGRFVHSKSIVMATYMLCGFANLSSVGMMLGGLGVLAPDKRPLIARLGFRAMAVGAMVSVLSATIVGMISG
jgi:CNT family concentrative nucleoside transporter